jgi:hypothetical protein
MTRLLLALIPIAAVAVGVWLGRRNQKPPRDEHAELVGLRTMREELMTKAAEHATLGDDFAVIALGILSRKGKPDARDR